MNKGVPPRYAELQVTSNFSFLRGASHPEELAATAAALGLHAIAITDRNTLAGVVRAHDAAREAGVRLIVGARLDLDDTPSLLAFPTDRAAYGRLARLISVGRRRAPKGDCRLGLSDLLDHGDGHILVLLPPPEPALLATCGQALDALKPRFRKRLYLAASALYLGDDARRLAELAAFAHAHGVPLVATNDVHAHGPHRRPLQDVLTCIHEHCTIADAGFRLYANAERHIKPPAEMARLFRDYPDAVARTVEIADACRFSLDELRYEYPIDPVPDGRTPQQELERLTRIGADERYPEGVPDKVRAQINHELALIDQLAFAPYFLTVHDIVRFARERAILCQGRGSAANSAVCFCLGITSVDPARLEVLFERFISAARNEPPDIDVDFEHERREEVIQYVYGKYGRERAGMTATVICYRTRSALREVGKVMGLSEDSIIALQKAFWRRSWDDMTAADIRDAGLDPANRTVRMAIALAAQLHGFPRHLSQHTGGMVITRSPLSEVVPIENAAMEDRTVIEWDKDDLDSLGILKIDLLGLGMLSCIRKSFELIERHHGRALTLATLPAEDGAVYDMLCRADSVGVFQVESRAQMTMLPRLKPRCFYDLVIEVAIVRPGPIQGDMVHPYLRRRQGLETVTYPTPELEQVLGRTLGVPLFQEQAMRMAIVAAGFTPGEADALRRTMARFGRHGDIKRFRDKFTTGMLARGYDLKLAEACFRQIEGFAGYGFPESHSASFALLVYVSSWLKCHYPAAFACALLNCQPMGFYAPAQIVADVRRHGVEVRPVDVNLSDWDCTLEPVANPPHPPAPRAPPSSACGRGKTWRDLPLPLAGEGRGEGRSLQTTAIRLGFRQVKGLAKRDAEALITVRRGGYRSVADVWRRSGLGPAALTTLARADGFGSFGLDRRQALWAVRGLETAPLDLFEAADSAIPLSREPAVRLPEAAPGEQVAEDYRSLGLSLKAHPLALLRDQLRASGHTSSEDLARLRHGRRVKVAGVVTTRQRPGTASGVIFITLEDEFGHINLIVWPRVLERFRQAVLGATMMVVAGPLQREGEVLHVVADHVRDASATLGTLAADAHPAGTAEEARFHVTSRDFH